VGRIVILRVDADAGVYDIEVGILGRLERDRTAAVGDKLGFAKSKDFKTARCSSSSPLWLVMEIDTYDGGST